MSTQNKTQDAQSKNISAFQLAAGYAVNAVIETFKAVAKALKPAFNMVGKTIKKAFDIAPYATVMTLVFGGGCALIATATTLLYMGGVAGIDTLKEVYIHSALTPIACGAFGGLFDGAFHTAKWLKKGSDAAQKKTQQKKALQKN